MSRTTSFRSDTNLKDSKLKTINIGKTHKPNIVVMLCDFFQNHSDNMASFQIRKLTAIGLSKKGFHVIFMYPREKGLWLEINRIETDQEGSVTTIGTPGFLPVRLRTGGFGFLDCVFKSYFVLTYHPDIVQVVTGHRPSNLLPSLLGKYIHGSFIVDERWEWLGKDGYADKRKSFSGRLVSLYDRCFEISCERFYNAIIVISSHLKSRFSRKDKVHILPGGANDSNLKPINLSYARELLDISKDDFIIGLSNVTRNDHDDNKLFFQAFRNLICETTNLKMMITGTDTEYINGVIYEYGLERVIIFPGYVSLSNYNLYLSICNIFVLPYTDTTINRGRWPNKLGDYLCVQRPVVTNPTGDVGKLFSLYKIGFLCDDTVDGFYGIIRKIISNQFDLDSYVKSIQYVTKQILSFDLRIEHYRKIFKTKRISLKDHR